MAKQVNCRLKRLMNWAGTPRYFDFAYQEGADYWEKAVNGNCVLTIHHGDSDRQAWYGSLGIHRVNVIGYLVFPTSLPEQLGIVSGVETELSKIKR